MKKIKTWIGPVLVLPSIISWALWIKSFNAGANQVERVAIWLSHFPDGTTVQTLTTIAILTSLGSIVASSIALPGSIISVRITNIISLVIAALITLLNFFQLL